MRKEKNAALVLAAGSGSRMKTEKNKQFLTVGGMPVIARTLAAFSKSDIIDEIVVAAKPDEISEIKKIIAEHGIKKISKIVRGGATRQKSVYNGLLSISDADFVFIHDGARPFLNDELMKRLFEAAKIHGAAAPGTVPRDTVSEIDEKGFFSGSKPRNLLRNMQTPQVFSAELIKKAHIAAADKDFEFTDDCSLYASFGGAVYITEGEEYNIKLTVPEDLILAQRIIDEME